MYMTDELACGLDALDCRADWVSIGEKRKAVKQLRQMAEDLRDMEIRSRTERYDRCDPRYGLSLAGEAEVTVIPSWRKLTC